ncbi:hypothetical protein CR161_06000 [Prosthecochloris sp. ZM]|nr:hypothetical protein [Prosthecochloris sp.]RDD30299.1 hypothetical protein CR161_06000 [Prosthecochloris sp. ZM]
MFFSGDDFLHLSDVKLNQAVLCNPAYNQQSKEPAMSDQIHSAEQMVRNFKDQPFLVDRLKTDPNPLTVLEEAAKTAIQQTAPWTGDRILYRVAVIVLGSLCLIAALGSIFLVSIGKTTPEVLVALGSAAVGALVGLFAPTPTGK